MSLMFKGLLALSLVLSLWSCQGMTGGLSSGLNADSSDPDSDDTILADSASPGSTSGSEGYGLSDSAMDPAIDPAIEGSPSELGGPDGSDTMVERRADGITAPMPEEEPITVAAAGGSDGTSSSGSTYETLDPHNVVVLKWEPGIDIPWSTPQEFLRMISVPVDSPRYIEITLPARSHHLTAHFPEMVAHARELERKEEAAARGIVLLDRNRQEIIEQNLLIGNKLKVEPSLIDHLRAENGDEETGTVPRPSEPALREPEHCSYVNEFFLCATRANLIEKLRAHFIKDTYYGPGYYLVFALKPTKTIDPSVSGTTWSTLYENLGVLQDNVRRQVTDDGPFDLIGDMRIIDPTGLLMERMRERLRSSGTPIYIISD